MPLRKGYSMSEQPFEHGARLNHDSADKPVVPDLAERLKGDGLRVWLDEWVIQPGASAGHRKGAFTRSLVDVGPGHEPGRLQIRTSHPRTTHRTLP